MEERYLTLNIINNEIYNITNSQIKDFEILDTSLKAGVFEIYERFYQKYG